MQAKTELALLRSEAQSGRSTVQAKATTLEERLESMQGDLALLAQEAAKGGSAQHLQQLELVQLRSQLEDEGRDRRGAQDVATSERRALQERLDAAGQDARSSLQALDSDLCTLRTNAERQLSAHAASIEQAKGRLLQCAQAIEKQWSASKVQQQRLESLGSSGALHNQQLQAADTPRASRPAASPPSGSIPAARPASQERVEVLNKQQTRWRASLEDAVKATAADVQLVQAQCRSLENAIGGARADARRLVSEQENETQVARASRPRLPARARASAPRTAWCPRAL